MYFKVKVTGIYFKMIFVSVREDEPITDINECTVFSWLNNTVYDVPNVSDFINNRLTI